MRRPAPWAQHAVHIGVPGPSLGGDASPLVPPSLVDPQSAGTVVLPTQSSHRSHVFAHCVTCVQGGHFVGSPKSLAVHVGASRTGLGAPGIAQQPKQSHPFGTYLRQLSMHFCDCEALTEHSAACWPA